MGMSAFPADDTADMKPQVTIPGFHCPVIVTVNGKATGMTAGTGKHVKLEGIYHIIINFLRNRIAKIDRYSYHKHERWVMNASNTKCLHRCPYVCVYVTGNQTLVGAVPVMFVYSNMDMITEGTA